MSELIIGAGGISDPRRLSLQTRRRWDVPNEQPLPMLPERMRAAKETLVSMGYAWRSSESTYNCIGLVAANRRCWVDTEHVDQILRDDGLKKIAEPDAEVGDLVVYRNATHEVVHVGMVAEKYLGGKGSGRRVLSQMGRDGEYVHDVIQVPQWLEVKSYDFWTHRCEP